MRTATLLRTTQQLIQLTRQNRQTTHSSCSRQALQRRRKQSCTRAQHLHRRSTPYRRTCRFIRPTEYSHGTFTSSFRHCARVQPHSSRRHRKCHPRRCLQPSSSMESRTCSRSLRISNACLRTWSWPIAAFQTPCVRFSSARRRFGMRSSRDCRSESARIPRRGVCTACPEHGCIGQ